MSNSTTTDYNDTIKLAGAIMSSACVIALITAWSLLPPWRSLLNYISVNHIVVGTLILWIEAMFNSDIGVHVLDLYIDDLKVFLIMELSLSSVCLSLCGTIAIFMRMVSNHTGKLNNEKTTISSIVCGVALLALGLKYLENADVMYDMHAYGIFVIMTGLEVVNVIIFCLIILSVTSCCYIKLLKRICNYNLFLIGVPILCDTTIIVYFIMALEDQSFDSIGWTLYSLRLVPSSIIVLCGNSFVRIIRQMRIQQSSDIEM